MRDLRRFLEEGGAQVPAEQRSAVEGEIAELEKDLARASNAPGGPVEADPSPSAPEPPLSSALPPVSAAVPIDPWAAAAVNSALTPVRPPVSTQLGAAAARETTPPAWTYAVITGGFMLLGGAGGLYAWNDDRYQHWRTEDSALSDLKQQDIAQGIAPREDTVIRDRARRNDTLIRSVQRFDAVPFVVAGAGLAAMGIGLWGLLDRRNDAALQFSVGTSSVELDAQLFW
ncbi:MAG: hypothetical protein ABI895_19720 [Deltaproteobacteria bacterium]